MNRSSQLIQGVFSVATSESTHVGSETRILLRPLAFSQASIDSDDFRARPSRERLAGFERQDVPLRLDRAADLEAHGVRLRLGAGQVNDPSGLRVLHLDNLDRRIDHRPGDRWRVKLLLSQVGHDVGEHREHPLVDRHDVTAATDRSRHVADPTVAVDDDLVAGQGDERRQAHRLIDVGDRLDPLPPQAGDRRCDVLRRVHQAALAHQVEDDQIDSLTTERLADPAPEVRLLDRVDWPLDPDQDGPDRAAEGRVVGRVGQVVAFGDLGTAASEQLGKVQVPGPLGRQDTPLPPFPGRLIVEHLVGLAERIQVLGEHEVDLPVSRPHFAKVE